MKDSFILFLLLSLVSPAIAQDTVKKKTTVWSRHEIVVGYDHAPSSQIFSGIRSKTYYNSTYFTGITFISYKHSLNADVSVGITLAYAHETGTWHVVNRRHEWPLENVRGPFSRSRYTIAPEATFTYCNNAAGTLRLYGVFGIGYTRREETAALSLTTGLPANAGDYLPRNTGDYTAVYVCPIGFRCGKKLSGFVELGTGYKGLLNYGMTYKF